MIEVFKISLHIYDKRVTADFFEFSSNTNTRGHTMKLMKKRCHLDIWKYSFTFCVVDVWNDLPNHVVHATNINMFKNRLDKVWANQPIKFNPEIDYVFNTPETTNINEPNIEAL